MLSSANSLAKLRRCYVISLICAKIRDPSGTPAKIDVKPEKQDFSMNVNVDDVGLKLKPLAPTGYIGICV